MRSPLRKVMRSVLILLFPLLCAAPQGADQVDSAHQMDNARIKQHMQQWQQDYQLPSFSLAIAINNEVVFTKAIGYADVQTRTKATVATQYSVGSIAKPLTSLAIGRLLDDNKIQLSARVSSYLPAYPQYQSVTVAQLASHTGGIGRPWDARNEREFQNPRDHESPFEALDIISGTPLQYEPGTDFQYSSMGYVVLSAVVESASGENFDTFMTQAVFSPLGMTSTELDTAKAGELKEATYYVGKNDNNAFIAAPTKRDRSFLFGGGGYLSTPSDLIKISTAFSQSGFLTSATQSLLQTPILLENGEVNPQRYSIGWRVSEVDDPQHPNNKVTAIHHGGVTNEAATAFLLIIPDYNAAIAYATNTDPDAFGQVRQEALQLLLNVYHQRSKQP